MNTVDRDPLIPASDKAGDREAPGQDLFSMAQKPAPAIEEKGNHSAIMFGDFRVIFNYIIAETNKQDSGVRIGIFTVFIVVAIITMLESVISITPILFVQMGQEEAGAIDFKMTYASSDLINGDVNFYAANPFTLNYTYGEYEYVPLPLNAPGRVNSHAPMNKAKPLLKQVVPDINTFCVNEGDHYIIDGSIPLLNFKWYNETLSNMPGFNGFASRTIYPDSKFRYESKEVTNILLIIDSSWE